ncbi:hypothetical protein TNCV_423991 [Trichonephila clavipes]|nr:hypothetical protein TNCV_423991 [Trichonephila clavipes]
MSDVLSSSSYLDPRMAPSTVPGWISFISVEEGRTAYDRTTVQVADDIRSAMDEAWQRLPQTTVNGLMDRPPDQKEACIAA